MTSPTPKPESTVEMLDVSQILEKIETKPIAITKDTSTSAKTITTNPTTDTNQTQEPNISEQQVARKPHVKPEAKKLEEDLKYSYETSGILELTPAGYGFLRTDYEVKPATDVYISPSQIKRFWLRCGDKIEGLARAPKNGERYHSLLLVKKINDCEMSESDSQKRPEFETLTSIYPNKQIKLEYSKDVLSTRILDLVSPIGFGQRALIVSQPKAGKTTFLKEIAQGVAANHPDAVLVAILIGERPEEVTEIKRFLKGEVAASHFDESPRQQVKVANLALDRARRLVEQGKNVIILLDSITRLARAYNLAGHIDERGNSLDMQQNRMQNSRFQGRAQRGGSNSYGRYGQQMNQQGYSQNNYPQSRSRGSMSGGMDQNAMFPAKKFLGAARNCEEGGPLTIIGTALVGTESRMDDLIYEEFKGTGNMEVHLDRNFAEKRIFPAIDIIKSGTRKEELLFDESIYKKIVTLRRMISLLTPEEALTSMTEKLLKTKTNKDFLDILGK